MSLSSVCVVLNALRLRFFAIAHEPVAAAERTAIEPEVTPIASAMETIDAASAANDRKEDITMEKTINVKGMTCPHCVKHVTKALSGMEGVSDVVVDLDAGTAKFSASRDIADSELAAVLDDAGYEMG